MDRWLDLVGDTEAGRVDLLPQLLELLADACGDGGLESLLARQRLLAIPVSGHQHLVVSSERLRALMRVVVELYDGEHAGQARFGCSAVGTGAVAALDELFAREGEAIRFECAAESLERIRPSRRRALEQPAPEGLHATLRPYQEEGLAWLQSLVAEGIGGVLADDMGLGKTIQAGMVLRELMLRRRIRRVLVLTPAALRTQWREEMQDKFALPFEVVDRPSTLRLQREVGVDANPWRTHERIIASYHYLKQPDVLEQFRSTAEPGEDGRLRWDLQIGRAHV